MAARRRATRPGDLVGLPSPESRLLRAEVLRSRRRTDDLSGRAVSDPPPLAREGGSTWTFSADRSPRSRPCKASRRTSESGCYARRTHYYVSRRKSTLRSVLLLGTILPLRVGDAALAWRQGGAAVHLFANAGRIVSSGCSPAVFSVARGAKKPGAERDGGRAIPNIKRETKGVPRKGV